MKMVIFLFGLLVSFTLFFDKNLFKRAIEEDKSVLIYFSGSDWCHSCVKLKNNVIKTDVFADSVLNQVVFYEADFPRRKKISKEDIAFNENLAGKFNPQGVFPLMVLINSENEKIISRIGYNPHFSTEDYIKIFQKHLSK